MALRVLAQLFLPARMRASLRARLYRQAVQTQ
jgi:hypothetical protein